MIRNDCEFNADNIQSVELNLLNGQVDIILRALELYSYNLEYMLNSTDSSNNERQEKLAKVKYTYEQVLATQAEQVNSKSNSTENISNLGKNILKDTNVIDIIPKDRKLNVI